ncbi:hypothetical protein HPB51_001117 [Rhipicephalus microplus]|uniref:ABC transporter domain-containing protein n=1 Tax=Rhipicephalus microplus TaxID=6941 RepID=A0A9J6EVH8_RHIMP|nr:hypothetical protein HPB51_001117 [Rhipicephalus microplus]
MIMLSVDIFLYGFLAYYFDAIVPGEFGQQRSPFFIFSWLGFGGNRKPTAPDDLVKPDNSMPSPDVEDRPAELLGREAIKVQNLRKVFVSWRKEPVVAVDGVSLTMHEGQIAALLGHNGAGKSTLLNMLVGTLKPSSGSARIYDLHTDKPEDVAQIRSMLGVKNILIELDLAEKADVQAIKLSGGQKRKLSVGIALVGDPKIVFLDEPSSGMDPYSRRHLWSELQKRKEGKVIVLTTHFMDEADILAGTWSRHWKAILCKGKLRCAGTSLFLKNRFGIGYHLTMVVDQGADKSQISQLVQRYVPSMTVYRSTGTELAFILPMDSTYNFANLFAAVEEAISEGTLGVRSYGISMTTLEEVFLKMGEVEKPDEVHLRDIQYNFANLFAAVEEAISEGTLGCAQLRHLHDHARGGLPQDGRGSRSPTRCTCETFRTFRFRFVYTSVGRGRADVHPVARPVNLFDTIVFSFAVSCAAASPRALHDASLHSGTSSSHTASSSGVHLTNYQKEIEEMELLKANKETMPVSTVQPNVLQAFMAFFKVRLLLFVRAPMHVVPLVVLPVIMVMLSYLFLNKNEVPINRLGVFTPDFYPEAKIIRGYTSANRESEPVRLYEEAMRKQMMNISWRNGSVTLDNIEPNSYYASVPENLGGDYKYTTPLTLLFNDSHVHTLPILQSLTFNALYASLEKDEAVLDERRLRVSSYPWPQRGVDKVFDAQLYTWTMMMSVVLAYMPSLIAVEVVEDRQNKVKNQLRVSGLLFSGYWFTVLLSHAALYLLSVLLTVLALVVLRVPFLTEPVALLAIVVLFLLYVPASLVVCYVLTHLFNKHETAKGVLPFLALLCSMFPAVPVTILDMMGSSRSATALHYTLCLLVPFYIPNGGLYYITKTSVIIETRLSNGYDADRWMFFDWDSNILVTYVACLIHTLAYYFLLRMADIGKAGGRMADAFWITRRIIDITPNSDLPEKEDADVKAERQRVSQMDISLMPKVAVGGFEITSNLCRAFKMLGYCPQHDALWNNLTLREHLRLFAALRGIRYDEIEPVTNWLMDKLNIREHADKRAKQLSGGTKRKLSYAISMLGKPRIVLLDEPSTGMDPQSKRFLWDTICSTFPQGGERGALLTTHSMEEADALCTKVGIMVRGALRCLGSTQHLKNKYGAGYTLDIKMQRQEGAWEKNLGDLKQYVKRVFPTASLREGFQDRLTYDIPQAGVTSLANVFVAMDEGALTRLSYLLYYTFVSCLCVCEQLSPIRLWVERLLQLFRKVYLGANSKAKFSIEEFSFSQTTLEQVFLGFAKEQELAQEDDDGQIHA